MSFLSPSIKKAPPPPTTPTRADASRFVAGSSDTTPIGDKSLISTGPQGLERKAETKKRSLIGGG